MVQKHDATRLHWDFRLELDGTLKSWAVTRGPSLDPADKRLAVNTEDHPLEYLDFEDVIPEGNYGAGSMIVWDIGRVTYLDGTAEEGIARGKIDFVLSGFKLRGRFALVETGTRRAEPGHPPKPEWLLFKKKDAHSRDGSDLQTEAPESVLSGLTVEELRERAAIGENLVGEAHSLGRVAAPLETKQLTPMLCALEGARLDDPKCVYELKLDGVRIVADKRGDTVQLRYRTGRSATTSYPEIVRAVRSLPVENVVLDGEIIAFDDEGRPSFQRLGPRIHAIRPRDVAAAQAKVPVVYLAFDVLALGDASLLEAPLVKRKALLMKLLKGKGLVRALDHIPAQGQALFDLCRSQRLEGVVAKRADSPYRPGPKRFGDWVKIKCERDDDFVVVGSLPGKGNRTGLGALCVGSMVDGRLYFRGRVGSGLDRDTHKLLEKRLGELASDTWPCAGPVPEDLKGATFVRPEIVVRVQSMGFTEEGRLRAPVFLGIRDDVRPEECTAMPPDEALDRSLENPDDASDTDDFLDEGDGKSTPANVANAPAVATPRSVSGKSAPRKRVTVSNRSKVFWPDERYTKGDLCDYYERAAKFMLPFLRGRPVVLVRYPDGIEGKSFYQWRAPQGTPDWIRTLELYDEDKQEERGEGKSVFLLDDVDALVHIANLGCIPLHVLAGRETSPTSCDFLTIDFDIAERPFQDGVRLALTAREILTELGLVGYPKTSGQKGLHVLVPLGPGIPFETAKILCELIGRLIVGKHPDISTMERRISGRGDRVYVDTGQTGRSRTIVAPYSVRAYPGATVSTPLAWEEVHLALEPSLFTMFTVPERLESRGDPMATLLDERPDIASAVAKIGSKLKL
jgi:bifunctional non-homologous end joining protein LigD